MLLCADSLFRPALPARAGTRVPPRPGCPAWLALPPLPVPALVRMRALSCPPTPSPHPLTPTSPCPCSYTCDPSARLHHGPDDTRLHAASEETAAWFSSVGPPPDGACVRCWCWLWHVWGRPPADGAPGRCGLRPGRRARLCAVCGRQGCSAAGHPGLPHSGQSRVQADRPTLPINSAANPDQSSATYPSPCMRCIPPHPPTPPQPTLTPHFPGGTGRYHFICESFFMAARALQMGVKKSEPAGRRAPSSPSLVHGFNCGSCGAHASGTHGLVN